MSDKQSKSESGIPGFGNTVTRDAVAEDSITQRSSFKAFHQSGRYIGREEGYGATISNTDRLFYSTREPVGVWWIKGVAYDIWDNWFRVINPKKPDDESLDRKVQKLLLQLKARIQLPRETVFERRYGTSILLLSYTGFGSDTTWKSSLFELNSNGLPPKSLKTGAKLLQITPYPWTQIAVATINEDTSSIRLGLPEVYTVNSGSGQGDSTNPSGQRHIQPIEVHWTRIILDAPRLDEHPYVGVPAIDSIFDDLVGARNARWGAYESYYRHGTGFPVVKTKGTKSQNEEWIKNGGLDDFLNVRGYMVLNVDESFTFEGANGKVLNPNTYFDMYFTFVAAATGVAKDSISGISAGRVTGSESNERKYFKSITLQQNQKEPMLRELIDRLIQTGQIADAPAEYIIDWIDPFEVNPQDKAAIDFMEARTLALKTHLTINEKREIDGLDPHPDGDVLSSLPGMVTGGSEPAPNQEEPVSAETEPEEKTNESTLLDKIINKKRG